MNGEVFGDEPLDARSLWSQVRKARGYCASVGRHFRHSLFNRGPAKPFKGAGSRLVDSPKVLSKATHVHNSEAGSSPLQSRTRDARTQPDGTVAGRPGRDLRYSPDATAQWPQAVHRR